MPQKTNQSTLKKLLGNIKSGDFKYEHREKKQINWSAYDQAQINEITDMLDYIRDIVDRAVYELHIIDRYAEDRKKPGQPPVLPGYLAKSILVQQYFQASNRVAQGLIKLFREKLDISSSFSYKSIERAYSNSYVKEILHRVFLLTQEPVAHLETEFSTDGTGIPTSIKYNYEREKYGKKKDDRNLDSFEQAIITIGSTYQIIADFVVTTNPHAGESPYLEKAVSKVADIYQQIDLWSGDAGYDSRANASAIGAVGAIPRIYPKKNDTFQAKGSPEWKKMHYSFVENTQEWLREYHKRSLSETVNSTYLRMFPKPLARRMRLRRKYEAFTRACGYNIKRLVYLKYLENIELGHNEA
jgi:transposase